MSNFDRPTYFELIYFWVTLPLGIGTSTIYLLIHFCLGNVQVEVTNLPADWVEEGIDKIRSIANAYGDPAGEIPTEKVYQKGENEFVIVYKQPKYATKMFETLHLRQIDEFIVKVSEPHPIEWIIFWHFS